MIPNNILKSNFVAILPTNVKKNTRTAKFFIRFLSVCVLFGGQKYEKTSHKYVLMAHSLTHSLRMIFAQKCDKEAGRKSIKKWYAKVVKFTNSQIHKFTNSQNKSALAISARALNQPKTINRTPSLLNGLYTPFGSPVSRGTETPELCEETLN